MTQYEIMEVLENSNKALTNKQIANKLNLNIKQVLTAMYSIIKFYKKDIKIFKRKNKDGYYCNYYKWVK